MVTFLATTTYVSHSPCLVVLYSRVRGSVVFGSAVSYIGICQHCLGVQAEPKHLQVWAGATVMIRQHPILPPSGPWVAGCAAQKSGIWCCRQVPASAMIAIQNFRNRLGNLETQRPSRTGFGSISLGVSDCQSVLLTLATFQLCPRAREGQGLHPSRGTHAEPHA